MCTFPARPFFPDEDLRQYIRSEYRTKDVQDVALLVIALERLELRGPFGDLNREARDFLVDMILSKLDAEGPVSLDALDEYLHEIDSSTQTMTITYLRNVIKNHRLVARGSSAA